MVIWWFSFYIYSVSATLEVITYVVVIPRTKNLKIKL